MNDGNSAKENKKIKSNMHGGTLLIKEKGRG